MASLFVTDNRLSLRYENGRSYSFSNVRVAADNQGMLNLGNTLASIQNEVPTKIVRIVTSRLV